MKKIIIYELINLFKVVTITFGMLSHSSQLLCLHLFIFIFEIKKQTIEMSKVSQNWTFQKLLILAFLQMIIYKQPPLKWDQILQVSRRL